MEHAVKRMSFDKRHYDEGIKRVNKKTGFEYFYIDTRKQITNKDLLRIEKLRIPPAWEDVWISQDSSADIQAIGTDDRGRKQYRYHQKHIEKAEQMKFLTLYDFIKALPKLEKSMLEHSKYGPYSKERVIVTMLTIIKELTSNVLILSVILVEVGAVPFTNKLSELSNHIPFCPIGKGLLTCGDNCTAVGSKIPVHPISPFTCINF